MGKEISRRNMIKTGAAGLALAGAVSAAAPRRAREESPAPPKQGANDRIRVAVVGIHGQGSGHLGRLAGDKGVEVVYLADPDSSLHESRIKMAQEKSEGRSNPKAVQDVRRVLDDKSVDAISIATPNHWHSLIAIWAVQAGKDVYVEKPMSHNIHEGRIVVEAAQKHNRIVQHGTQSRSDKHWWRVAALVKSGKLGKLRISRGLCYKDGGTGWNTRGDIGFAPYENPPETLDFDLWQGPAKFIHYHKNLVHYRWHWFWATGNGDLGNQGVHQMDVARWMIPGATLPKSCVAFGGRLGHLDQGEAASTHVAIMDFGETLLIFETRGLPSKPYLGQGVGNILHFDEGVIAGNKFFPKGSDKEAPLPEVESEPGPGGDHFGNWLAALRSRKVSDLNANCLEGHYSAALCHLANMSIRLGNRIPFKPRTTAMGDSEAVEDVLTRTEEYLAENGIDLEKSGMLLGRKLMVDTKNERIIDDDEANLLVSRDYRKGFEVPDKIA